ncbi:MAG: glycosyltransferase family 1 protein [Candidatus Deferrimicrobium sp.]
MKIGIDAHYLQDANYRAGLHQYTLRLVEGLQEIDRANEYTLFFFNWRSRERDRAIEGYSVHANFRKHTVRLPYRVFASAASWFPPLGRIPGKVDVFHGPAFRLFPEGCYRKAVVTVHDLMFMKDETFFPDPRGAKRFRAQTADAVSRADAVVAVSEFTREDLIERFGLSPDRVRVIHNGVGEEFQPLGDRNAVDRMKARYGIHGSYILFVGYMEPKKNLPRLLRAFDKVRDRLPEPHALVLAGPGGPSSKEVKRTATELSLGKALVLTGHVPPEELPLLYSGASLFVFPSLCEGFGLPPLEAMACGTPVVASNSTSLPEVVGSAGVLVDPLDTEDIARGMFEVLADKDLKAALVKRGIERSREFSWSRTARQTLGLYEEL